MQSVQDPSDNELTNADGIEGKHMERHRHSLQSDRSMIFFSKASVEGKSRRKKRGSISERFSL